MARRTFTALAITPVVAALLTVTGRSTNTLSLLTALLLTVAGSAVAATAIITTLILVTGRLTEAGAIGQTDLPLEAIAAASAAAVVATLFVCTGIIAVGLADAVDAEWGRPRAVTAASVATIAATLSALALGAAR
jgi:hypothetical protein